MGVYVWGDQGLPHSRGKNKHETVIFDRNSWTGFVHFCFFQQSSSAALWRNYALWCLVDLHQITSRESRLFIYFFFIYKENLPNFAFASQLTFYENARGPEMSKNTTARRGGELLWEESLSTHEAHKKWNLITIEENLNRRGVVSVLRSCGSCVSPVHHALIGRNSLHLCNSRTDTAQCVSVFLHI